MAPAGSEAMSVAQKTLAKELRDANVEYSKAVQVAKAKREQAKAAAYKKFSEAIGS